MAIQSMFFDALKDAQGNPDRVYSSEDFSNYLNGLVHTGVFKPYEGSGGSLAVRPNGGMSVAVDAGAAWVRGHKMINTADYPITLDASDPYAYRIDAIAIRYNATSRDITLLAKKGAYAPTLASANAPSRQLSAYVYELYLAHVIVRPGQAAITQADIIDKRGSAECPWVAGMVNSFTSDELLADVNRDWDTLEQTISQEWESIKGGIIEQAQFISRTTANITSTSDGLAKVYITRIFSDYDAMNDVLEVYVNGLHLNSSQYRVTNAGVLTLTTPITMAGQKVELVRYSPRKAIQ